MVYYNNIFLFYILIHELLYEIFYCHIIMDRLNILIIQTLYYIFLKIIKFFYYIITNKHLILY
jgi:hypothetical protein